MYKSLGVFGVWFDWSTNWFPKRTHNFPADFPQTRAKGLGVPFYLLGGLVHCSYMGFLLGFVEGGGDVRMTSLHHFVWCGLKKQHYKWVWVPTTVKHMILSYNQLSEQWTRNWNYVTTCPLIQITLHYTKENKTTPGWAIQSFSATATTTRNMHAWNVPPTKKTLHLRNSCVAICPCQHEWFSALIRRSCWKNLRLSYVHLEN